MLRKIKDILRLNDLTEQEITVYTALLALQKATIPMIRQKCGLPNITVYRTICTLVERGYVQSKQIRARQKIYTPLSLAALANRIAAKERKLRRMELELRNLDSLVPYMNEHEGDENSEIEVRMGVDALREEYLNIPDTFKDEFLLVGNFPKTWAAMKMNYESAEERWFINQRLKNNVYGRVLNLPSEAAERVKNNDSREKRTTRLTTSIPIKNDCLMFSSDHTLHFVNDPENPRVIIIRNPELVGMHHKQFDMLWAQKNA